MRVQSDARHVQVRTELPPDLRPARADPEKLQRVLFNRAGIPVRSLLPLSDDHLVRQKIRSDIFRGRRVDTGAEGATAR